MRSPCLMLTSPFNSFIAAAAVLAAAATGCQPVPKTADDAASGAPSAEATTASPAPPPAPHQADEAAAHVSADAWVELVDQSRYGESWDAAAPIFQASMTKEQWDGAVQGARGPLGPLALRKFRAAEYKASLPGAPEGEYVVIYYDSAFAEKQGATESVTLAKTTDGAWKVAGYFIQ